MAYNTPTQQAQSVLDRVTSSFGRWGMISLVTVVVVAVALLISLGQLFENLDAHELMVIQSPVKGELAVYTDSGLKWQGFGKVTKYPRRHQFDFPCPDKGKEETIENRSLRVRFNDGGHGYLCGAVSWDMPLTPEAIVSIHKQFGSPEAIEQQAVSKMLDSAVYFAGPLMSSTESSGARRAELVQDINDQAVNGVYVTTTKEVKVKEDGTSGEKTVTVMEVVHDEKGLPKRQQSSILSEYGIKLLPLSIKEIRYDNIVEKQIAQRQEATTAVQISIATARKAEQDAVTIAKQGEAKAADAKWKQETVKAQKVTEAQQEKEVAETQANQRLNVAKLDAQAAEQFKRGEILKGEGEAARKKLVLEADGALEKKLEAMVQMNKDQWTSIAAYGGQWTPSVVMGGVNGQNSSTANNLIELLTAKTAKDLGVDLTVPTGRTVKKDGKAAKTAE